MDRQPRSIGVRAAVLALVLALLVPITLFAGGLIVYLWTVQRDQLRERQQATVENLTILVTEELQRSIQGLEALASSSPFASGDIDAIARLAGEAFLQRTPAWRNIVLSDAITGRQLFNLAAESGLPLPGSADRPHQRLAVASGKPAVSDLFVARATRSPVVEVAVPVHVQDQPRYVLAAQLSLDRLGEMLNRQVKPQDVAIIVDSGRRIIARTRHAEAFIGKQPVAALDLAMQASPSGWQRFIAFEGDAVYSAWAKVPDTEWSVAYGIAATPIEQALRSSLALLALVGLLPVVAAAGFAAYAVRRIGRAMESARSAAELAAAGRMHAQTPTGIRELDALYESLREAAKRVASEADERMAIERRARNRVEAESRSKDEFLAMLGHELRNPLAAIANAAQVLKLSTPGSASSGKAVEVIVRQTAQQKRLLDDLLDVARVSTGKLQLQRAPLDLAASVRHALTMLAAAGRLSTHRLTTRLDEAWVNADATRIEQIVANLVGNSLKFTPHGGEIEISTATEDGEAVLRVSDDGVGIDAAMLPRVFELFAQDDPTPDRAAGGLGIGLTLVRRLAELHGGSARAESAGRDRGAEFTVRLPAIEPARVDSLHAIPRTISPARRILLVEDNHDVREMLQTSLQLSGHRVIACESGGEALARDAHEMPDVAIVDIGLPDMTGVDVARGLRARHGAAVRIIALSGFGSVGDDAALFDRCLVKPVAPTELVAVVDALFETAAPSATNVD